jgi:hypothetical protein
MSDPPLALLIVCMLGTVCVRVCVCVVQTRTQDRGVRHPLPSHSLQLQYSAHSHCTALYTHVTFLSSSTKTPRHYLEAGQQLSSSCLTAHHSQQSSYRGETYSYRGDECECGRLLGRCVLQSCRSLPTARRCLLRPSSERNYDEGSKHLWNVGTVYQTTRHKVTEDNNFHPPVQAIWRIKLKKCRYIN